MALIIIMKYILFNDILNLREVSRYNENPDVLRLSIYCISYKKIYNLFQLYYSR